MDNNNNRVSIWTAVLLVILAAVLSSLCTRLWMLTEQRSASASASKADQALEIIDRYYVGEYESVEVEDGAVAGMIDALGDRWSYYISAEEVESYRQMTSNRFAGLGVVIESDGGQTQIVSVYRNSPAEAAALPLDGVILRVNGEDAAGLEATAMKELIGKYIDEGLVVLTIRSEGEERDYEVVPAVFDIEPVSFELLEGDVGLIRVDNFDSRAGRQLINACRTLQEQGAKALVFDLRFNPGGQLEELLNALDYLLPEGVIFLSQEKGEEMKAEQSDAACLEMPMAVLVNRESYSAAEFFAAALQEYGWAAVVGEQTTGKGYAQITVSLSDGSAIHISARKYYTPNGVSLADVGVTPDLAVDLDDEDFRMLYYDRLAPEDDEQLQAAVAAVRNN